MKRDINDIKELELKCKECKTKITFDINERKKGFSVCPNCSSYLFGNDTNLLNDLDEIFFRLKSLKNINFSFICEEKNG